jgi:hypothetical protein
LERILYKAKSTISLKKAAELTHNMYEVSYILPESKHTKKKLLKMDDQQAELYQIIQKNLYGVATLKTGKWFQFPFSKLLLVLNHISFYQLFMTQLYLMGTKDKFVVKKQFGKGNNS